MNGWLAKKLGRGHVLNAGQTRISTTDQSDRQCGWCWHVNVDHAHGYDEIGRGYRFQTEVEAMMAAVAFARSYCSDVLADLDTASGAAR
ncbi:hypothetical protein [Bradyrhizobium sp. SZCCHNR1020]|uniref:hypothetical protein n=1 Tax=Bradyrhizobium sp. SZCCHNR1020 TaxID=3057343 RepID=UPI0029168880|nr:hypothetical protein [Bradyrhizobium sp. SZCCHNR1020]